MNLTKRRVEVGVVRRLVVAAACVAIGGATCASAMAMRMEVSGQLQAENANSLEKVEVIDPARVSPGTLASMVVSHPVPVYPATAKADKVQGAVILRVIIDKDGMPKEVQVYKGLRDDLDQSAVTAVKQWRWKPYVLNGEKTEVQSSVTVNYSLGK